MNFTRHEFGEEEVTGLGEGLVFFFEFVFVSFNKRDASAFR